jgi:formate dehydrogenase subunit gamma
MTVSDRVEQAVEPMLPRSDPSVVLRFRRSERHLHWAIAVPFTVCYATAAVLIALYNPDPARPFREVFSWAHRLSGLCLIVLPPLTIAVHWREFQIHLKNMRAAWVWTWDDVRWLLLAGPAAFSSKVSLPDQGKFNAGEKINFTVLTVTYPVYIVTGLMIWYLDIPYLSWIVHVYSATFIATPLILGHIFLATLNPDTRVGLSGMLSGFVDRHWARHHYRSWYDEQFGDQDSSEGTAPAVSQPAPTAIGCPLPAPERRVEPESWPRSDGGVSRTEPGAAHARAAATGVLRAIGARTDAVCPVQNGEADADSVIAGGGVHLVPVCDDTSD